MEEKPKAREKHIRRVRDRLVWVLFQRLFKMTDTCISLSHSPPGSCCGSPCSEDEAQQPNTAPWSLSTPLVSYLTVLSTVKLPIGISVPLWITQSCAVPRINHLLFSLPCGPMHMPCPLPEPSPGFWPG